MRFSIQIFFYLSRNNFTLSGLIYWTNIEPHFFLYAVHIFSFLSIIVFILCLISHISGVLLSYSTNSLRNSKQIHLIEACSIRRILPNKF